MENAVIIILLLIMIIFALRQIIKDKKSGKSLQCGGDCRHCSGGCPYN